MTFPIFVSIYYFHFFKDYSHGIKWGHILFFYSYKYVFES